MVTSVYEGSVVSIHLCDFFCRIRLNLETSVILLNVPLSEVYLRAKTFLKSQNTLNAFPLFGQARIFFILTFLKWGKVVEKLPLYLMQSWCCLRTHKI